MTFRSFSARFCSFSQPGIIKDLRRNGPFRHFLTLSVKNCQFWSKPAQSVNQSLTPGLWTRDPLSVPRYAQRVLPGGSSRWGTALYTREYTREEYTTGSTLSPIPSWVHLLLPSSPRLYLHYA